MDPSTKDGITLGIALLGAVLGVINIWRAIDRDRIRLRVIPQSYIHSHGDSGICIEVVNLGFTAVTITSIGFSASGGNQLLPFDFMLSNGERLPQRLEPRTAFSAYLPAGIEKDKRFGLVTCAFAKTACGRKIKGSSASLRDYIKRARAS